MKRIASQPVFWVLLFALSSFFLFSVKGEELSEPENRLELLGQQIREQAKILPTELGAKKLTDKERTAAEFVLEATNEILAQKISDEFRVWTLKRKAFALVLLAYDDKIKYFPILSAAVDEFDAQKGCEKVVKFAETHTLKIGSMLATEPKAKIGIDALVERLMAYIQTYPGKESNFLVLELLQRIEDMHQPIQRDRLMIAVAKPFSVYFLESKDPAEQTIGREMHLKVRFLELPGKPMRISGYDMKGEIFDPETLKGKVVLVQFWASWCLPCKEEFPILIDLYEKYKAKGFEILGVNEDEKMLSATSYVKETSFEGKKITWPILLEQLSVENEKVKMADYYAIRKIPVLVLIGRDGNVIRVNPLPSALDLEIQKALFPRLTDEEIAAAEQEGEETKPVATKKLESAVLEELGQEFFDAPKEQPKPAKSVKPSDAE